jgi:hypothetical protein
VNKQNELMLIQNVGHNEQMTSYGFNIMAHGKIKRKFKEKRDAHMV